MAEGRLDVEYDDGREIFLEKPGLWATGKDIREAKADRDAIEWVGFFRRYCEMGLPYGHWGENPNPCVEVVDALAPLRDIYCPRLM